MKPLAKFQWLIALLLITTSAQTLFAQTRDDIFYTSNPITWLGLDFSQTKFIGQPEKGVTGNNGLVSNDEFRDNYTVQWNELFINEIKKYDVAKATHRASVKYAIDVTLKANRDLTKKDFYSNNPGDFKTITDTTITDLVKNYNFQGNEGIGLMYIVEGMSKGQESVGVWVTFVAMKSKTVLFTTYETAKPGGFGFRNYWARPFFTITKNMASDFDTWK